MMSLSLQKTLISRNFS